MRLSASRTAVSALPYFEPMIARATAIGEDERDGAGREQRRLGRGRLQREAEQILEIGEAVVAAEAEVVAEELLEEREGHRLGDDREIDAGHARAEGEPAEGERQQARDEHDHQHGVGEPVEAPPGDRQLLPVQEHHEVGQDRIGVDAARADLAHQIHAHRIAAEREERAVAERQDAAIAPDEIERDGEDRVAEILAEKLHQIGRDVEGRIRRASPATATGTRIAASREKRRRRRGRAGRAAALMLPPPGP